MQGAVGVKQYSLKARTLLDCLAYDRLTHMVYMAVLSNF